MCIHVTSAPITKDVRPPICLLQEEGRANVLSLSVRSNPQRVNEVPCHPEAHLPEVIYFVLQV